MPEPQKPISEPAGPTALQTLGHYLFGGLVGALLGLAFATLVFYLLVIGFLYAQQPVLGATQETVTIPQLPAFPLAPPITAVDLTPPEGKLDATIDTDYLGACWQQFLTAIDIKQAGLALAGWAIVAGIFGLAIGFVGAIFQLIFGQYYSPLMGILALLAALAAIGMFVARVQFEITLPFELNVQKRLFLYAGVAALNLLWISVAGFRFRAILFTLATVVVGEGMTLGLPPQTWTTTSLWHASLFLFIPAGYGWRAVERGQQKGIIA